MQCRTLLGAMDNLIARCMQITDGAFSSFSPCLCVLVTTPDQYPAAQCLQVHGAQQQTLLGLAQQRALHALHRVLISPVIRKAVSSMSTVLCSAIITLA